MSDALPTLGVRVLRRVLAVRKPFVRMARRRARSAEQRRFGMEALEVDREIAQVASGTKRIIAGPWLAEVGYEVLYWIPFLRWFTDTYRILPNRMVVVSRGGVKDWYSDIAATYMDILDHMSPGELAARNAERQAAHESNGQKQSAAGPLDREIIAAVCSRLGLSGASVCHPSLLFRLFRHVWYGNLPLDFFWTRTRYARVPVDMSAANGLPAGVPPEFIAAKFYGARSLPLTDANQAAVRSLVARAASVAPVVSLDADFGFDEHRDFDLAGIPNVISARGWMTPGSNLAMQSRLIARSRFFLGTCGGLAWLAPFLGTPTTAVYSDDQLLGAHLMIARQAGRASGAAEFAPLDLRALRRVGFGP